MSTLWRGRRFRGRADGTLVALETPDGQSYRRPENIPVGPVAPIAFRKVVEFAYGGATHTVRGSFVLREITKEFSSSGGTGSVTTTVAPFAFEPGKVVPVAYDPANRSAAILRGDGDALQVFSIQTFIGLMCVVVALLIFFFNGNLAWLGPDWHR